MVSLISAAARAMALLMSSASAPVGVGSGLLFSVTGGAVNALGWLTWVSRFCCCASRSAMRRRAALTLSPVSILRMSGSGDFERPRSALPPPSRLACQRVGLDRRARVLGVDEDDFQARVAGLDAEGVRRDEVHRQQRAVGQQRNADGDVQESVFLKRLHS